MSYNTKNYTEQGGETTHFGGKVVFESGCVIEGLPTAANQAASTAETVAALVTDFNGLLTKLKTAGLMVADEEPVQSPDTSTSEANAQSDSTSTSEDDNNSNSESVDNSETPGAGS